MKKLTVFFVLTLAGLLAACAGKPSTESTAQPVAKKKAVWPVWPVWIDTDPSVTTEGERAKEVDDGFALIQAFNSPELEIRGITVVFGNAPFEMAWPIGQEIVRRFGPANLPIFPGAAKAEQLGEETEAVKAMAEALRAAAVKKEKLTILSLGPVTNVATLVKNHAELAANIEQIIAVAGRRPGQSFKSRADQPRGFRDFNFELDASGFQALLDSTVPLVLAPWEVSSHVWLRADDLQRLQNGTEATRWIYPAAAKWLKQWQTDLQLDGFNPFDTLAIGYLTSPQMIKCEDLPAAIKTLPDDTQTNEDAKKDGKRREKPYLLAGREVESKRTVKYCYQPAPEFK
ncbi:MAG: nucleoside hydrolase, partial [Blastocatellia bacterium]